MGGRALTKSAPNTNQLPRAFFVSGSFNQLVSFPGSKVVLILLVIPIDIHCFKHTWNFCPPQGGFYNARFLQSVARVLKMQSSFLLKSASALWSQIRFQYQLIGCFQLFVKIPIKIKHWILPKICDFCYFQFKHWAISNLARIQQHCTHETKSIGHVGGRCRFDIPYGILQSEIQTYTLKTPPLQHIVSFINW